ncbi:MAG TPA: glycosyltransferase [Roseimicrobium sp.]|nr:glycosyltransferase [Roseimicrobium sp.]
MKNKAGSDTVTTNPSALDLAEHPMAHDFRGHLDVCGPNMVTGWVYDHANPGKTCEVEIRADGLPVARVSADLFRIDLVEKDIGDGLCGFQAALPASLFDGRTHLIDLREASTGFLLPGSSRVFVANTALRGDVRFGYGSLTGTFRLRNGEPLPRELDVLDLESGKVIATGVAEEDGVDATLVRFTIPLPAGVFDGKPHAFSVRAQRDATLVHEIALITPCISTQDDAVLKYARRGMTPALATAAGFRYESLVASLEQLARPGAEQARGEGATVDRQIEQVVLVHRRLVRGFDAADRDFEHLVFPHWETPVASVVIPAHNKFHVTYHALASLLLAPNKASFEVILVDDGSDDITLQAAELVKGVQHLRNEIPQGFIRSSNLGAAAARGKYVVMLNNDTEVTAGWLDELIWPFEHFNGVGLTGAKLLFADGSLQEAGGIVWGTGNPANYGRRGNASDPRYNYARQVDYVSGACLAMPRELWLEIGGFSTDYLPAYFEDTDLAFQVRSRGLKTVYAPLSQVFHFEGMSNGTDVASGTKRFQEVNRPRFKRRWSAAFRDNGREGFDIDLIKDRNVALRVLVIDAQVPMPDQDAGSYAAVQEIRMLQALGFKCTFVPQNMAWMANYTRDLQRMGVECLYAPFQTSIAQVLEERGPEFDLVYITRYYVAKECVDLVRRFAPRARVVLMNSDLHFLRELRLALQSKEAVDMVRGLQTRDEELAVMRKVDLVLSYTDVEKAVIISHNLDSTKVAKCPWTTEIPSHIPSWADRTDIAFLGGFNHLPNVGAVEWFAAEVMPLLRRQLPGVKFHVYGSNMPDHLASLAATHADIELHGWMADVAEIYNRCRIFVAPLQTGAGIKGKVIGALAHGVPTVMTAIAAEGLPLSPGVNAVVAGEPHEWEESITALYNSRKSWQAMSAQAVALARANYGYEHAVGQMKRALEDADLFVEANDRALALKAQP